MAAGSDPSRDVALLAGMPLRYLREAAGICETTGTAVLPAGAQGDLARTRPGTEVLLMATQAGENEVPAATWSARFHGAIVAAADSYPDALPPSWVADRRTPQPEGRPVPRSPFGDDEAVERSDDPGQQCYFEVGSLEELPRAAWVFVNELVPKQQRGGRTYVPRSPRLVERPA
jgi:hypothetical protein